jgi:hypothetical protein
VHCMKKKPLTWGLVSLIVCCICAIPALTGSLWFPRELIGQGEGFMVGKSGNMLYQQELEAMVPNVLAKYGRVVYANFSEAEYIVGIPRIVSQRIIAEELTRDSWEVRRFAYIVYARRTKGNELPPAHMIPIRAMGKTILAVAWKRLPAYPQFIAQGTVSSQEFSVFVEESRIGLYGVVRTGSSEFRRVRMRRGAHDGESNETSYVAIQRDLLQVLPEHIKTRVENKVSEAFRFIKTRPNILEHVFMLTPEAVIATNGDSIAIGIRSIEQKAADYMHEWIHTEQGVRHPEKKAFYLPDNTIGYEYIPGSSNASFSLNKANNGCLPSEGYDEQLFLCAKDDILVMTSSDVLGEELLLRLADPGMLQRGVVQQGLVDAVGLGGGYKKIEYTVIDEGIEFWIDKKE